MKPNPESKCPSPETLQAVLKEALAEERLASVTEHLDHCEDCQQRLANLSGTARLSQFVDDKAAISEAPCEEMEALIERMKSVSPEGTAIEDSDECDLSFLEPSDDPELLGTLGNYLVTRLIARGGMGVVLEAREPDLDRVVAIKVLAPALAASLEARKRFMREAKAAAGLEHENIMPIFAVCQAKPLPYLVMPFIKGMTLDERIQSGTPLENEELVAIALKVARGLEFAHRHGVIHRDIKPANILLDQSSDRVLLTDFGLARVVGDVHITAVGVISGTPQYMAPEQAEGGATDHRSDLFSFGSVLYHMASGKPPFKAKTVVKLMRQIAEDDPEEITRSNSNLPTWLVAVTQKLLAKRPEDRFQDAREVVQCLSNSSEPSSGLGNTTKRLPWLWAALGVVVCIGGWLVASQRNANSATGPFQIAGTSDRYETLRQAIDEADNDAVIVINESANVGAVTIENKRLRLRSGESSDAVLTLTQLDKPTITTNSALWIEGLTFLPSDQESDRGQAVIVARSAPLSVNNCRFVREEDQYWGRRSSVATVHLIDCQELTVANTLFACRRTFAVFSENTQPLDQTITITNSVIVGERGISFKHPEESHTQFHMDASTVYCRHPFIGDPAHLPSRIDFDISNVVFRAKYDLIQMPMTGRAGTKAKDRRMSWVGENNLYAVNRSFLSFFNGPRNNVIFHDFEDWQRFAVETNSTSTELSIDGSQIDFEKMSEVQPEDVPLEAEWQDLQNPPGAQSQFVGPGAPWRGWRETESGKAWREQASSWER